MIGNTVSSLHQMISNKGILSSSRCFELRRRLRCLLEQKNYSISACHDKNNGLVEKLLTFVPLQVVFSGRYVIFRFRPVAQGQTCVVTRALWRHRPAGTNQQQLTHSHVTWCSFLLQRLPRVKLKRCKMKVSQDPFVGRDTAKATSVCWIKR